jgi:hypothetical protein
MPDARLGLPLARPSGDLIRASASPIQPILSAPDDTAAVPARA